MNEMVARVKAVLRRSALSETSVIKSSFICDGLTINYSERSVTVDGNKLKLTPLEYNLLRELALNEGKVLTHAQLLLKIWGSEYQSEKQYLHVFIQRLRNKMDAGAKTYSYITTIPGIGYKISRKAA